MEDSSGLARRGSAPIGFHIIFRLEDDRPIATTVAALRTVARVVLEQGESRGLLAFGAADDHLHAQLATDRSSAGAFARYVQCALRWRLGLHARFERARIRPLRDQRHAYNTFHYAHRQDVHHRVGLDPAREGTSLPDLLGLRLVSPSLIARVRAHLPRVRHEELIREFPDGVFDVPADEPIDLEVLADAAASVLALPHLRGHSLDSARARRAAVHAAGLNIPSRVVASRLGLTTRTVQSLRVVSAEPTLTRAVERRAALCRTLRRMGAGAEPCIHEAG